MSEKSTKSRTTTRQGVRPTRTPASDKRRQARRRKKQMKRRLVLVGLWAGVAAIIAAIVLIIVHIVGARFANTSTIMIDSDGAIEYDEVESFEESNYDKGELEDYTKDLVDKYNKDVGVGKVKFGKTKVSKDTAYMRMKYSDYNAYNNFTGNEIFVGTIAEAQNAGYDFQDSFEAVEKGEKSGSKTIEEVTADTDNKVVIIRANVNVRTPEKILYVSGSSTNMVNKKEVAIKAPDGNEDATGITYIIYSK